MTESSEMNDKTSQEAEIKEKNSSSEQGATSATDVQAESTEEATAKNSEDEVKEWKNKAAYLAAEIENMTKRFQREKSDLIRFANEGFLLKVVPVIDNLVLALKAGKAKSNDDAANEKNLLPRLVEGVEMTLKHFEDTLKMLGVEFIETINQDFDPNLHEAVGQSSDKNFKDNTVSEEFQRGFKLNGRVARAAKVVVNKLNEEEKN